MAESITNPFYTFGVIYTSPTFKQWEASKGAAFKAYREAWVSRPHNQDAGDMPLNVDFEVTTRCNLACTFCTQPSLTTEEIGDVSFDLFKRVVDEAASFGIPACNLNGLGEPLLVKRLPDMIRYAKQAGFIDVMFHTNGTIMTEAIADALIDSGLDRLIFSVDAPDKQTYESMRVKSDYDRVERNVKMFINRRHERGSLTPVVRATMIVTDETLSQVPAFIEKWKPLVDQLTLQDLTWRTKMLTGGLWKNGNESALPMDLNVVRDYAISHKIGFVCPYLFQTAYVLWNGDSDPCSNPNGRKHMVMGDYKKQPLREIWNGRTYHELRDLHRSGRWHEHPICRDCEIPLIEIGKVLNKTEQSAEALASNG